MKANNNYNAKKYFFFKINDYLNNHFHFIEKKRYECLELYLLTCMETFKEYNADISNDKPLKAYKALIEGLSFMLEHHPFRNIDLFKKDFRALKGLIESKKENKTNDKCLLICLSSFTKKLSNSDTIACYISVLKKTESFKEVDILISSMLSDLLYKGYSLKHIKDWFNNNLYTAGGFYKAIEDEELIDTYINKSLELNFEKKDYEVILKIKLPEHKQGDIKQYLTNHFDIIEVDKFNIRHEWLYDKNYSYLLIKSIACDEYKAISIANHSLEIIINSYKLLGNYSNIKTQNNCAIIRNTNLEILDMRNDQNIKLLDHLDERQKNKVDTFLDLRFTVTEYTNDLETIERVLHTLEIAKTYDSQNRFLNYWSTLEYLLYTYPKSSIIEKARIIVPKSLCLYFIKDKLNIFWERFCHHKYNKLDKLKNVIANDFYMQCKKDNPSEEYSTKKIIAYLSDPKKAEKLRDALESHIILQRELMELNFILTNKLGLKDELDFYRRSIETDLNLIYRFRNQIIHSANSIEDYLDFICLRLYKYIDSIVATILYYKRQCPSITTEEVLNSINDTFDLYLKTLSDKTVDINELARPLYLYVERK